MTSIANQKLRLINNTFLIIIIILILHFVTHIYTTQSTTLQTEYLITTYIEFTKYEITLQHTELLAYYQMLR